VNLTGLPDNDLDYYIYELGRLQDAARDGCFLLRCGLSVPADREEAVDQVIGAG
jgi:hypothetical protein